MRTKHLVFILKLKHIQIYQSLMESKFCDTNKILYCHIFIIFVFFIKDNNRTYFIYIKRLKLTISSNNCNSELQLKQKPSFNLEKSLK